MLDVSPSTEYHIEDIRRAAVAFVDKLLPQDSVIVIKFDHGIDVLTKATKDRQKIYKAIDEADFGMGTSLYNAVDEALRKQTQQESRAERRSCFSPTASTQHRARIAMTAR